MLVGLPCSGKSTIAQSLQEKYCATVFSSDALRMELYNDVNDQEHNQELFVELHRRIKECLRNGKSAIMDATNINYKKRMAFLSELKNIPCEKICVVMATPYEECVRRNKIRERKVPEYVVKRMHTSFDIPWYYEGWDDIKVEYPYNFEFTKRAAAWYRDAWGFNQDNPHHILTLGQHCLMTYQHVQNLLIARGGLDLQLIHAALLHDVGKCFTKTFTNSKGEITDVAHYYGHERAGCYESLFYKSAADSLYIAVLIRWHMQPYFWEKDNNEKLNNKYRKLWGERLYADIIILHEADKQAH